MNYAVMSQSIDIDQLESALGIDVVTRNGEEDIARCPLSTHSGNDRNPSFSINRNKKLFNCFACGRGGTLINLVSDVKSCSFEDAVAFCRTYSLSLQTNSGSALAERIEKLINSQKMEIKEPAIPVFSKNLINPWVENLEETDFFLNRGISLEVSSLLLLGYDSQHQRGSYVGPAVIIPHIFRKKLVGYQERWINAPSNIPKYTNTKDFPKKSTLYNYDNVEDDHDIVVVESAITVAYLATLGYSAIATFGASVQQEQIRLIKNICSVGNKIILSFDNDEAGRNATKKVVNQLKNTVPLFVVDPPDQDKGDLNDLTPDEVSYRINQASPWWATKGNRDGI